MLFRDIIETILLKKRKEMHIKRMRIVVTTRWEGEDCDQRGMLLR